MLEDFGQKEKGPRWDRLSLLPLPPYISSPDSPEDTESSAPSRFNSRR